jgi:hypothetical protein
MVRLSRAKLGQLAIVIVLIGVAVATFIGVSKLAYPTVTGYPDSDEVATVEPIQGTDTSRITLTADAAERIGLRTDTVTTTQVAGKPQLVIPYAAVFYDPLGATWAYVASEPLVFARQRIAVDSIQGDTAYLSVGPPDGAKVVTVGVAALYGSEVGVEEE